MPAATMIARSRQLQRRPGRRKSGIRGQATAEMAAGLIAIMIAFVGLIQLGRLGFENVRNTHDARTRADELMMAGGGTSAGTTDIGTWTRGPDGLDYTQDDVASSFVPATDPTSGRLGVFTDPLEETLVPLSAINSATYNVVNSMSDPLATDSLAVSAGLHQAETIDSVPLDPVLRSFIFSSSSSLHVRDRAAMPTLKIDGWMNQN